MSETAKQEQFASLLTGCQQRLLVYIRSLVPHRADADEILLEVNLYLCGHFDQSRSEQTFPAWACQVAYYQVLTHRKRESRNRSRFSEQLVEELAVLAESVASEAERRQRALEACLQRLTEADHQLVLMRYENGATTQDVATRTGRSTKGIYQSLDRIRSRLQQCIARRLAAEERAE